MPLGSCRIAVCLRRNNAPVAIVSTAVENDRVGLQSRIPPMWRRSGRNGRGGSARRRADSRQLGEAPNGEQD